MEGSSSYKVIPRLYCSLSEVFTYIDLTAFPVQVEEFGNNLPMAQELDAGERGCAFVLLGTDYPEACFSAQPGEEGLGKVLSEQSSWEGVQGTWGGQQ